jgi:predicted nucleic acid-binding protein
MTIGLDTSIVLRLLTGQPKAEAELARTRLEKAMHERETVIVTDLVLAEAYFALHHHYGVTKTKARATLLAMVHSGVITAVPGEALWALEPAAGAGLVDRLIHARHRAEGAISLTFDRKVGALEGVKRLGR